MRKFISMILSGAFWFQSLGSSLLWAMEQEDQAARHAAAVVEAASPHQRQWIRPHPGGNVRLVEYRLDGHELSCGFLGLGFESRAEAIGRLRDVLSQKSHPHYKKIKEFVANGLQDEWGELWMTNSFPNRPGLANRNFWSIITPIVKTITMLLFGRECAPCIPKNHY